MDKKTADRLIRISELLEKALECLDNILSQFIDAVKELPVNEQQEFNKILHNFCYHMKGSLTDLECMLIPCKDYSCQYII